MKIFGLGLGAFLPVVAYHFWQKHSSSQAQSESSNINTSKAPDGGPGSNVSADLSGSQAMKANDHAPSESAKLGEDLGKFTD